MPQIPYRDPDLFETVNAERQHVRPPATERTPGRMGGPRTTEADAAFVASRKAVWEPTSDVLGVLHRTMHGPDIAKFTGLQVGAVCATLLALEADGIVEKAGSATGWDGNLYDLWRKVLPK